MLLNAVDKDGNLAGPDLQLVRSATASFDVPLIALGGISNLADIKSAVNYSQAYKYGIRYIFSGSNTATEGMSMPPNWNWFKRDKRNIYSIARQFGGVRIKAFPAFSVLDHAYYELLAKIRWIAFLDFSHYNKKSVLSTLEADYDYKPYPFKHYESIFTRFYQGYILPTKFGVDKRLLHLSTLVMSGQMSREDALCASEGIAYVSQQLLDEDTVYFLKKMGWARKDLDAYINRPEVLHSQYQTEKPLWEFLLRVRSRLPERFVKTLGKTR